MKAMKTTYGTLTGDQASRRRGMNAAAWRERTLRGPRRLGVMTSLLWTTKFVCCMMCLILAPAVRAVTSQAPVFSIHTTPTGTAGTYKYWGAVAVGTVVYFGPDQQSNVGVFDTAVTAHSPQ